MKKPIKSQKLIYKMTEEELFNSYGVPYRSPSELEEEKLKQCSSLELQQYRQAKAADDWFFNDSDSLPE